MSMTSMGSSIMLADGPSEGCPDRGTDRGNFIFGLKGLHAEVFILAEFVQNIAGRCDGVGPEEQGLAALLRCGQESP